MHLTMLSSAPLQLGHDPQQTAYNLGRANVARELDQWIQDVNLQCWLLMHREAREDDASEQLIQET